MLRQIVKVCRFIPTTLVNKSVIKEGDLACQSDKEGTQRGIVIIKGRL
jgi:hypothetical protein